MKRSQKFIFTSILCAMLTVSTAATPVVKHDFPVDYDEFSGITDGYTITNGFHNSISDGKLTTISTFGIPVTYVSPDISDTQANSLVFSLKSRYTLPDATLDIKIKSQDKEQLYSIPLSDTNANVYTVNFEKTNVTGFEIFVNAVHADAGMYVIELEFAHLYNSEDIVHFSIGQNKAYLNGEEKELDAPAFISENRTLTPARFVAESLGATVSWDDLQKKVTVSKDNKTIEMFIGKTTAYIDGQEITLDCAPVIKDGRTYTPARFVAEALEAHVIWDVFSKTVIIDK